MRLLACLCLLYSSSLLAQPSLQELIAHIAIEAKGTVGVACLLPGGSLDCDLNAHNRPPMQSVFKFPLAITVLHLVDTGKLLEAQKPGESLETSLDRTIRFLPGDRIVNTYSPLQDRYPEANVAVPLRELIQLSAGRSDNTATQVLLRIIGGPSVVQTYIRSLGVAGFQLQDGEDILAGDPNAQYRNWFEPSSAAQLLGLLVTQPPLSKGANAFMLQTLTQSMTAPTRLRAGLPEGTILAHKSGTSGEHNGMAAATNDIGLITLPDGRHMAIAVFVTDSRAEEAARDRVIARICKAIYDEALILGR